MRRRLANYERLYNAVAQVYQLLYQGEGNLPSVSDQIRQAATELSSVQTYDQELQPWCETLQSVLYNIEDLARSLRIYQEGLAHDDAALQAVEQRLDLINNLKRKYGDTLSEVIGYAAEVEAEIQRIENSAALASRLQEKMAQTERAYRQAASELTQYRQQAAVALERQLHSHLADLGLANAVLQVQIETNTAAKPRHLGQDAILFMFNANPGEIPKPLTKVISGGEMSRLMLALKTLLASHDMVGTLVFDEIDAGLGGQQALAVGGKLRELAKTHQVICISHLANIAAMADQHLQISKSTCHGSTYTRVKCLQEQERVEEIARMLDGQLSSIALTHARELLEMAQAK